MAFLQFVFFFEKCANAKEDNIFCMFFSNFLCLFLAHWNYCIHTSLRNDSNFRTFHTSRCWYASYFAQVADITSAYVCRYHCCQVLQKISSNIVNSSKRKFTLHWPVNIPTVVLRLRFVGFEQPYKRFSSYVLISSQDLYFRISSVPGKFV